MYTYTTPSHLSVNNPSNFLSASFPPIFLIQPKLQNSWEIICSSEERHFRVGWEKRRHECVRKWGSRIVPFSCPFTGMCVCIVSVYTNVYLCLCMSVYVCVCLCVSVYISLCMSVCVCIYLSPPPSIVCARVCVTHVCVHLCISGMSEYVCVCLYISLCAPFACMRTCLSLLIVSAYTRVCLCMSVCICVCLCVFVHV